MHIQRIPIHFLDEDEEDDLFEEDHKAIIQAIENSRHAPIFEHTPKINIINNDHAIVPQEDPLTHQETVGKHPHVHNDLESHSNFYMFGTLVLIAALGLFIQQFFLKKNSGGPSDMMR